MRRQPYGFTLIELMIVVAMIGILASVALAAYADYLREARMVKVTAHYRAPGRGPAFVAGAGDANTGAIGLTAAGTWVARDSQVTIMQPAYDGLPVESMIVTQEF